LIANLANRAGISHFQIRLVSLVFYWENQLNAAKSRVYWLNDKVPIGFLVSPAMQHAGPFPASLVRFAALHGYDNLREPRLPPSGAIRILRALRVAAD